MEWMQDWEEFEQQGEDPGRLSGAQAQDYGNWRGMNGRNGSQEATVREKPERWLTRLRTKGPTDLDLGRRLLLYRFDLLGQW